MQWFVIATESTEIDVRILKKDPRDSALVKGMDGSERDTMIWHFPNSIELASAIRIGDNELIRNYDHVNNAPELGAGIRRTRSEADGLSFAGDDRANC